MWGSKSWHESHFEGGIQGDKWGHRWRGSQQYRFDFYMELLADLRTEESLQILDIGCALGDFTKRLEELSPAVKITGIDIAENAISAVNSEFGDSYQFAVSALPELPFADSSFDLVVCTEVLYYLEESDLKDSFHEIRRVLADDGEAFISSSANKGERYFSEDLVRNTARIEFDVTSQDYLYGGLYSTPESLAIRLIHILHSGRAFLDDQSQEEPELDRWLLATLFGIVRWLDRNVPYFARVAVVLSRVVERVLVWLVSLTIFAQVMDTIARKLPEERGKSHVVLRLTPKA